MEHYAPIVRSILAQQLSLPAEEITEESLIFEDLGADSLDAVEMLAILEEQTGIPIPDEDILRLKSVGDIIGYLCENAT